MALARLVSRRFCGKKDRLEHASLLPFFLISLTVHFLIFFRPGSFPLKEDEKPKEVRVTVMDPPPTPEPVVSEPPPPPKAVEQAKEVNEKVSPKPTNPPAEKPEPPSASRQVSKPKAVLTEISIHQGLLEVGRQRLKEQDNGFPEIIAHYEEGIGFNAYANYMHRLGGRFFVRDLEARKIRAEINLAGERLIPVETSSLGSLSPRSRDLSDEPYFRSFVVKARQIYGDMPYGVVLLVPESVDAVVIGGIEEHLRRVGKTPDQFLAIEARYQQKGKDLILEILSGQTKSRELFPLNLALNLSKVAQIGSR